MYIRIWMSIYREIACDMVYILEISNPTPFFYHS